MNGGAASARSMRGAWAFSVAYCLAGLTAAAFAARITPNFDPPFHLHWFFFAVAFAVTERFTVDLEVRREAHTLSFTEVATTIGLVFGVPLEFVLARIVASVVVLVFVRRVQTVKLIFNTGVFATDVGLSVLLFHLFLGSSSPIDPAGWAAALGAIAVAHLVGALALFVVMRIAGAPVDASSQAVVAGISLTAALSGSAVALGATSVLWRDGRSWVLLLLVGAALGYFFVSFVRVRERHQDLARLHEFTTTLMGHSEVKSLAETAVLGITRLLKAERASLFIPVGDSVVQIQAEDGSVHQSELPADSLSWVTAVDIGTSGVHSDTQLRAAMPLAEESGIVVVEGRVSAVRAFDGEDQQLLETAAGQAGSALQNAQLVNKLREEAAFRAHQALHDDVTDLPNQRGLVEQLGGQLRSRAELVMLTVRIHSLREVNETLGRSVGDEMLRKVAERLLPISPRSWCARSGTDEFTLVVPGGQADADEVAQQIVAAFEHPVQCTDVALAVTVGIGVALAPEHGTDGEMLVRRASLAASRSALDGTTVTTWAEDRDPYDPQRLTIAADLRDAIPAGELEVHFQPQVDMRSGTVTGAEALVRWTHPRLGPLRPDQFIPAAEHTGAIDALTFHVLTVAAQTGRRWHDRGWEIDMAVNLSARNLTSPRFAAQVADILEAADFPASSLTLELTESSVMTEAGRALATLDELHALGIELSIDDFGTGYSSLAHLRRLPVGEIKIDKSFVFDLTTNESDEAIVKSMVELGHTLSLRVVVEGVETVEVRDRLAKIGSDRLQGYLVSRPLSASAFESWMHERQVRVAQPASATATVVNFHARR